MRKDEIREGQRKKVLHREMSKERVGDDSIIISILKREKVSGNDGKDGRSGRIEIQGQQGRSDGG